MNLNDYISSIEAVIDSSPIVVSYQITIDRKTSDIAFISGIVEFRDSASLDFKEFIESSNDIIEKYKYAYNYRKGSDNIFRYDNAPDPRTRSLKSFPRHKHLENGDIVDSEAIELADILNEIEKNYSLEDNG